MPDFLKFTENFLKMYDCIFLITSALTFITMGRFVDKYNIRIFLFISGILFSISIAIVFVLKLVNFLKIEILISISGL